jgi:hypothetical protein
MSAELAVLIGAAYEELSSRCFDINVPTAGSDCIQTGEEHL